jgi:hypothetical protein
MSGRQALVVLERTHAVYLNSAREANGYSGIPLGLDRVAARRFDE